MRNIRLTIEYDGTKFSGWQVQPRVRTVQDVLQKALRKMTGGEKVMLQGASRTDAGVHALAQVGNFRTSSRITCQGFMDGLNSLLPDDVAVKDACEMPEDFHAKRDSKGKHYRYLIMTGAARPAIMRNRMWFMKGAKIDATAIQKAAQALVGEHDFSAFCASGDTNKGRVRRIDSIKISVIASPAGRSNPVNKPDCFATLAMTSEIISIDITGNGFLKYMVRNIVGTLLNSKLKPDPKGILDSKDRKKAGVTAPACGLYLVEVFY